MGHRHNSLLFTIVVRPMDSLVRTAVRHRMIQTAVICKNKIKTLMMVLTRVRIIKMMVIKMIITSHVINGQTNHSHMVVAVVRLIVVPVHPEDRTEIQVRKMILVINPKPNADQVIIFKIKITLVLIIMVRKAVSVHLVISPALVVDQDPADSLVV